MALDKERMLPFAAVCCSVMSESWWGHASHVSTARSLSVKMLREWRLWWWSIHSRAANWLHDRPVEDFRP
jgi:hypothetical protein